jgi:trk system potassium uptake protein
VGQAAIEQVAAERDHQGGYYELQPPGAVEHEEEDDPGRETKREQPHEGEREPHPAKSYNPQSVKVLIVGCGRVGSRLAANLSEDGHDVTVVDRDQSKLNLAASRGQLDPATFKGNVVLGDGTDAEVLRRAGIEASDAFVAVTEGDNRNIMAAQIAQHVFKVPRVVCRIYDPVREETYRKLGLGTYCPTVDGTAAVTRLLMEAD